MMINEEQLLAGFNDGYTIQQYEPELARQMIAELDGIEEDYVQGFLAGAKEHELEKELEKSDLFPGMDEDYKPDAPDLDQDMDIDR